ncbi:hypothetical protein HOS33_gp033 [Erwinia phage vB_EamM_Y3]|uniref:Uncharacterized protein n=1 Tax=Erwinia phage vB_EamM_Y3 TaxID=1983553 RepID=A0A2H4IAV3_9CAUD|nr:hypothetical protein HOS33_gp033 [Erwinia phage vB_EamM_Y3]ARW58673.1 hypothetical protein Y3_033 [Erwinia phage vB_EamM_Y3]QZE55891.1 hypothetical protein pEaSNUABM52_00033 [Erwinia phage pEp_SNUABM_52]
MNEEHIEALRERLAKALGYVLKCGDKTTPSFTSVGLGFYVDAEGKDVCWVSDWLPDSPDKILQVIERYGLSVERVASPNQRPQCASEVKWEYHVWSRMVMYRNLSSDAHRYHRVKGARVTAKDLTTAVLTWAVLRAEHVLALKQDALASDQYNFDRLKEKVYVSEAGHEEA